MGIASARTARNSSAAAGRPPKGDLTGPSRQVRPLFGPRQWSEPGQCRDHLVGRGLTRTVIGRGLTRTVIGRGLTRTLAPAQGHLDRRYQPPCLARLVLGPQGLTQTTSADHVEPPRLPSRLLVLVLDHRVHHALDDEPIAF
jgi:hypothetical protein